MICHLFIILVLNSFSQIFALKVNYNGYKVYNIVPQNENQVKVLKGLENKSNQYQFWSENHVVNRTVNLMVAPNAQQNFMTLANFHKLHYNVMINNVQDAMEKQYPNRLTYSQRRMDWHNYHRLKEVYSWMRDLANKYRHVRLIVAGESYEGRQILGVHVSYSKANEKRTLFFEGNIHAREWISCATVTFILNEILTSNNTEIRRMAENYDWYFFPITNPDGYEYTFEHDRMWRKSRKPYCRTCVGVDLNRNWPFQWRPNNNKNSEIYPGPHPLSEVETRSLSQFIKSIGNNLHGYLSIHAYSQVIMTPYGHTKRHLDNFYDLYMVGTYMRDTLQRRYGTEYRVGSIAEIMYYAYGASVDWVKATLGTKITYAYELRDKGTYGFLLPPDQIIPTGLETLDSILAMTTGFEEGSNRKLNLDN